ncbi:NAD-dependent epimerase/dehydratase family protein [Nocardioides aequoreus]|uniref:NAD-dependent epimerase/dehydratase family protein n=1 Tax=Nocardioides aequoreus TaxID=397278 RepID=UPI000A007CD9|nr:NAD-dependent epimerase/dehydratase family protein [Nocardioides aequoreus]
MRILVLGASGYVGSRLVPALLGAGHEVVAASSSAPRPDRFAWGHQVDWARCDVTEAGEVAAAVADVDAVCYLVHSLDRRGFEEVDRIGAEVVRDAVRRSGVRRVVYLSGLVPDAPLCDLSPHIRSRLEVEQVLLEAASEDCTVAALRAGVVIGAGSTSFEVIRQLATLLVVQPVPTWLEHKVQPVAVTDLLRAMTEAFDEDRVPALEGAVDVGGLRVLSYSRLLAECSRAAGLLRLRVPVIAVPSGLAGVGTAALVAAPFWTVTALVQSLRHDMVCRPSATWEPADAEPQLSLRAALLRCFGEPGETPEAPLPSDEPWTSQQLPLLDWVPAPATVRAGAGLVLKRARGALGALPFR